MRMRRMRALKNSQWSYRQIENQYLSPLRALRYSVRNAENTLTSVLSSCTLISENWYLLPLLIHK